MSDYFIHHQNINAYTITAFAEAIVEATKQGLVLDFDSARRIGSSFSISIVDNSTGETQVDTEETPADQTESVEAQSTDEPVEDSGEDSGGSSEQPTEQPFTVADIDAAADSMELLKQLGDPIGVSARSKREMVKQLKEHIGA